MGSVLCRLVWRVAEQDLFRSALASDEPPFSVLYVFGPGGVGKTTLLREFVYTISNPLLRLLGRLVLRRRIEEESAEALVRLKAVLEKRAA